MRTNLKVLKEIAVPSYCLASEEILTQVVEGLTEALAFAYLVKLDLEVEHQMVFVLADFHCWCLLYFCNIYGQKNLIVHFVASMVGVSHTSEKMVLYLRD